MYEVVGIILVLSIKLTAKLNMQVKVLTVPI